MRIHDRAPRALIVVLSAALVSADGAPDLPRLNQAVLEFALGEVGKSVGDGECTSLAVKALAAAGARRFPPEPNGDYIWGESVGAFAEALPGDILQFRDVVLDGVHQLPDGRVLKVRHRYAHHTAIVARVEEGGRVVSVLHQNVSMDNEPPSNRRKVRVTTLYPRSLKKPGRIWIYRPVDREATPRPTGNENHRSFDR